MRGTQQRNFHLVRAQARPPPLLPPFSSKSEANYPSSLLNPHQDIANTDIYPDSDSFSSPHLLPLTTQWGRLTEPDLGVI